MAKRKSRKHGISFSMGVKEKGVTVPARGFAAGDNDFGKGYKGGFAGKSKGSVKKLLS